MVFQNVYQPDRRVGFDHRDIRSFCDDTNSVQPFYQVSLEKKKKKRKKKEPKSCPIPPNERSTNRLPQENWMGVHTGA